MLKMNNIKTQPACIALFFCNLDTSQNKGWILTKTKVRVEIEQVVSLQFCVCVCGGWNPNTTINVKTGMLIFTEVKK